MRPGASDWEDIAGNAEPLEVPEAFPVCVAVAVFDAEPEPDADPDPVADADPDAVSPWEDGAAEPPDVAALLSFEPGSFGRPCAATLAAKARVVKRTSGETPERCKSRIAVDDMCSTGRRLPVSYNCRFAWRLSTVAGRSIPLRP